MNVAPGRPLALFERALYGDGLWPGNVGVTACIDGTIAHAALQRALALAQARHPLLRCLVVERQGRPWFELQDRPPPIPLRVLERRGEEDWVALSAQELQRCFDGRREPLARLLWLRGETRSELVLVCHHAICDGRALSHLLGELLHWCEAPERSVETRHALPSFSELLPAIVRTDPGLQRSIRWRAAALSLALRWLVRDRPAQHYGAIYRELWTLDEAATRRLSELCRAQRVSAYVAISLAFVLAFRSVCGPRRIQRFVAPVDMRSLVTGIGEGDLFGIAPTVELRPGKTDAGTAAPAAFWERARALQADLQDKIEALPPKVYRNFLGLERLHHVFERMVVYARSRREGRQLTLSNLGRLSLAQDYRGFHLRAVRGISGVVGATPAHQVVISRYAGRYDFALASDEESLPRAQAQRIREHAMELLLALTAEQPQPGTAAPSVPAASVSPA
ncbi:condensation domain-containing protein [Lysobacter sp. 5GHs7-4]|uniref:condensation domain-containing protein n=1 Tax=Lysobacter sp. 5GHs7-4 TaxID=2904253 RepID=UPI001E42E57F|nr:condensation domain-containing protein [Lysobacter sp. 5GHs7-4]UHQ22826.1 condensation domain-containing protein [Lysobacter sp. 5GHs7-4]